MAKGKRIVYLDLVKLFTIYLVILGHVIAKMVGGYAVGGRLIDFIYSFHMPLFMLLSGYFVSSRLGEILFLDMLWKKGRQLLLPAFTCTIICCVYLWLTKANPNYRDEVIGNSWFLKTLFIYYVLFGLLKRLPVNDWVLCVISCIVLFLIPGCSSLQVNLLFPYFWGGYHLRRHHVLERISSSWHYVLVFLFIYGATYSLQRYWGIPNYIAINFHSLQASWDFILLRYIVAFSGSLGIIAVISFLYKYFAECRFFNNMSHYGQWTLGVYVLQTILVANVFPDTLAWYVESEVLLDLVVAPILSLAFLLVCLCLIHLISKNRILDLVMFGGQYYKR